MSIGSLEVALESAQDVDSCAHKKLATFYDAPCRDFAVDYEALAASAQTAGSSAAPSPPAGLGASLCMLVISRLPSDSADPVEDRMGPRALRARSSL